MHGEVAGRQKRPSTLASCCRRRRKESLIGAFRESAGLGSMPGSETPYVVSYNDLRSHWPCWPFSAQKKTLKSRRIRPIHLYMTITGQPAMSLLDSVLSAGDTRVDVGVAVLKKAQDADKQQGEAVVNLLESAGAQPARPGLDVFA